MSQRLGVIQVLRRYCGLMYGFFQTSLMADLEYRINIVTKVFTDIIWYTAQLSLFEVLFKHSTQISGWTIDTMRVFLGVLFVVDSVWMFFFWENLDNFSDRVRKGELDMLLTKPVNSQFMLSFKRLNTAYLINILMTMAWLGWSLASLPGGFSWVRLLFLLISLPCAIAITYGMRFLFSVQALIFTRAENINYAWYQLYRLATRPDTLYPPWLRYVILTIVPVGFIASVPARLILDTAGVYLLGAGVIAAIGCVAASHFFWKFALRFYSSASS